MARFEGYEEDLLSGDPRDNFMGRGSGRSSPNPADTAEDVEPHIKPLGLPSGSWTLLPIIEKCDNAVLPAWPPRSQSEQTDADAEDRLVPFFVEEQDTRPVGFLRPKVLQAMLDDNEAMTTKMKMAEPCWQVRTRTNDAKEAVAADGLHNIESVAIAKWINDEGKETRSEHMDRLVRKWREQGLFSDELGGASALLLCTTAQEATWTARLAQRAVFDLRTKSQSRRSSVQPFAGGKYRLHAGAVGLLIVWIRDIRRTYDCLHRQGPSILVLGPKASGHQADLAELPGQLGCRRDHGRRQSPGNYHSGML